EFTPGHGWLRGGYKCRCKDGFYPRHHRNGEHFNGSLVEVAWASKMQHGSGTYDLLYVCLSCPPGCGTCEDDTPCLANYNWTFRIALLTISCSCIVMTLIVMAMVYRYRNVKVFRLASPIFLCVCLTGCIIMYLEMAAIFPVLDKYSCIATKWSRHMGFCTTFSALLMKTWR
ncbi:unnamed protein product, partial [Meganyctiphanes norvegica]